MIISETFCPFPWMHLHAWPDGRAMLCCVAHGGENNGTVGDFDKNTYEEIMNSEKLKQIRFDMMKGEKIPQCIACTEAEGLGKESLRLSMIKKYLADIPSLVMDTYFKEDGSLINPKMLYMDFRFSNLCNLGCQTCGSVLSSTIANNRKDNSQEEEILKGKNVLSERGTITSFVYARPEFMEEDVYPYIDDCKAFYFAGGEPLMHQEHLDILNYLNENKLYSKSITYSSNLSILRWKKTNFLDIWKNFKDIHFMCSIDGDHERLEYVREFSKHDVIFTNLKKLIQLKEDNPQNNIRLSICYTHSIYNCYYTKEFIHALEEEGVLDKLAHIEFNHAYGEENSIQILPKFAKEELKLKRKQDSEDKIVQKAFHLMPTLKKYYDTIDQIIDTEGDTKIFNKLINNKLLENEKKFRNALPWLASVYDRHRII